MRTTWKVNEWFPTLAAHQKHLGFSKCRFFGPEHLEVGCLYHEPLNISFSQFLELNVSLHQEKEETFC